MAGRPKKCVCCGEYIGADEDSVPYKGRYAHYRCFQIALKTLKKDKENDLAEKVKNNSRSKKAKPKPKAELKDAVSEEDYAEKKQFYQYLRKLSGEELLSAKVYALSDHYISRYNFTFKGMYQTLVYLHEILEKELVGDIAGLIPYYYTEAERYYENIEKIEEKNKDIDISTMYREKTIFIKPKQRKNIQIDIESVGKEEYNV